MKVSASSLVLLLFLLLPGCAPHAEGKPVTEHDIRLPSPSSVLPAGSDLLGYPSDVDVDESGRIWITDQQKERVVVVEPESGETRFFGRGGWGAGEFMIPARIEARDSVVRIFDRGNSRVQTYRPDGTHLSDRVIRDMMVLGAALLEDGRLVIGTAGEWGVLARVFDDEEDSRPLRVGQAFVPFTAFDPPAIREEAAAGRVPELLRNVVVPVPGRGDDIWLLLQADGEVRRYASDGELIWSRALDVPEVAAARNEFFRRNAAGRDASGFHPLHTMVAAREVGDRLWVLMNTPSDSGTAVWYGLERENGDLVSRFSVQVPGAVNAFTVDAARGVLYLTVPAAAGLLAVDVRDALRR